MVRMRIELTTLAFGRYQFEPKRDVTTRRDPPLSFFGEICVDSQRVESADWANGPWRYQHHGLPTELTDQARAD